MRLRTFGGLWIEGERVPTPGPRPLALLALVAAAGAKGISRDRVIGILWAETGEDQGRHTLSQTLYSLRRSSERDLIAGAIQLRLDPSLTSDIGELRSALETGDYETAARLYTGKFLDGFYLSGAPEFERWVEEERAALELEVRRALERLAKQADEGGPPADAVHWWHRLAELDHLSARYAAGYIHALVRAGDRTSALARARAYREMVQRELGAEPDPEVRKLEQSLQGGPPKPLPTSAPSLPDVPRKPQADSPAAPPGAEPEPPARRHPRWLVPAALVALVAIALAMQLSSRRRLANPPFLAVGEIRIENPADSAVSGRVLRDMLATSLGAIEGLQVVANSRLVELMSRDPDPAAGSLSNAARRAGATELIEGELGIGPEGPVLSLRRVTLDRGLVRKGYLIRASDRYGIVDSAAAAIARDLRLTPPLVTVAQIRTASPAAYVLYEEGLRAFYGYDGPAALRLMSAALERDSSFAMAAWYAWRVRWLMNWPDSATTRALERVQRLAGRTIERERLLIEASVAEFTRPLKSAVAIAETLSVRYPTDPDGQFQLGTAREKQGDWAGAVIAYERAFALDSLAGVLAGSYCRVCQILDNLSRTYLWWDSAGAAERAARRLHAVRPNEASHVDLVEALARQGRRAEAEAAEGPTAWSATLVRDLLRWGRYADADRECERQLESRSEQIRNDARWLLLLSLRDQGRLQKARGLIEGWNRAPPGTDPSPGPPPIDVALLGVEMGRPDLTIRAHRQQAQAYAHSPYPAAWRARAQAWNLALAGTALAAAGDTAALRRVADSVELIGQNSNWARDTRLHHVLRGLLFQALGDHSAAVEAFRRSIYSLSDGYSRANLMLARSLLVLGRGREAVPVLQPALRGGIDGNNTYVSRTELHEALAEAYEQTAQRDSALAHWRAVESGWRRADPQFRDRYERARLKASGQTD